MVLLQAALRVVKPGNFNNQVTETIRKESNNSLMKFCQGILPSVSA